MQRIEEVLVNDFDRYSVFLDSVREQLSSESEAQSSGDILQVWSEINTSEALASALSRNNFEEALSIIHQLHKRSSLNEEAN